jgi:protein-S-isoprenylcysteine O-methyltransferase Ste14
MTALLPGPAKRTCHTRWREPGKESRWYPHCAAEWPPAILAILVLVVRTALEDRMLQKELPGYKEYAHRVCYRLILGVR